MRNAHAKKKVQVEGNQFGSACPLCACRENRLWHRDRLRAYHKCAVCKLVFVPPEEHICLDEERREYALHENDPRDAGYRRFLSKLAQPLIKKLPPGARGLDYGCGPGPTLSVMLEERGHPTAIYDPFFAPDTAALEQRYDFVTCTEVVEHCSAPLAEIERMWSLIEPGGCLGIMTGFAASQAAFARWQYIQERSHICFFCEQTFHWIGDHLQSRPEFPDRGVVIFLK